MSARSFSMITGSAIAALIVLSASVESQAQRCLDPRFRVELVAEVPEIEHPSVVTCDPEGNLYVGEDPMDMRGPTTEEFDRIVKFSFDDEGRVAQRTVFAEGLSAVFGLVWWENALYVMHAPHYSVFRDEDGDGVAESREDLADGFGPPAGVFGFNDHIVTGTRMGLDGYIYVSVGDKGIQRATGSDGSTITLEGGGVVRMRPDGTELEIVSTGTRNHLDVAMDSLDNIFTYDNTDDGLGWWTRFTHQIPSGYYGYPYDYLKQQERHLPRISEHGGGSPVGAACYREAVWPEEYREAAFHCEWGKGKVQVFFPDTDGATFTAEIQDFLVGEDGSTFRPQDLCFSPDGRHMYVADWNYGGWTNDTLAGRLYRVTYVGEGSEAVATPIDPGQSSTATLIDALGSPSHHVRIRAQEGLARRGKTVVDPLITLLRTTETPTMAKVHAIWTFDALVDQIPGFDPIPYWVEALSDNDPIVRAQAARALGTRPAVTVWSVFSVTESERAPTLGENRLRLSESALASLLFALAEDDDPRVRLQSAIALGRLDDARAVAPLVESLGEEDSTVRFAVIQALRFLDRWEPVDEFLTSAEGTKARTAVLTLTGVRSLGAVQALVKAVKTGRDLKVRLQALEALATVYRRGDRYETGWWGTRPASSEPSRALVHDWEGTEPVLQTLRSALDDPSAEVRKQAISLLSGVGDEGPMSRIRALVATDPIDSVRIEGLQALRKARDSEAVPLVIELVESEEVSLSVRELAVRVLEAIGADDATETLTELAADDTTPSELMSVALETLASLEATEAIEVALKRLDHPATEIRTAAVRVIGVLDPKGALKSILPRLDDPETAVSKATLQTLAQVKAREAIPAILTVVSNPDLRAEAIRTLGLIPDPRALSVYLSGLTDRDPQLRELSGQALIEIRDQIVDDLRERQRRNELTPETRRELTILFGQPQPISSWQLIGAWPQGTEDPYFDFSGTANLDQVITIGDRELRWRQVESRREDGRIDPGRDLSPTAEVWAMATTTVDANRAGIATWRLGSDDQGILWINGEKIHEFLGNRGWDPDQASGEFTLREGTNTIWFQTGNTGGPWSFSLAIGQTDPAFEFLESELPQGLDPSAFAAFAAENRGDPNRGAALFFDPEGIGCVKCHAIGDRGRSDVGPNLVGVGAKYPREELVRSILEPSNRIASGYEMSLIATLDGQIYRGVVRKEVGDALEIADTNGEIFLLPREEIDELVESNLSAMPNGLEKGMTLKDFADIVAYLESLKQEEERDSDASGSEK